MTRAMRAFQLFDVRWRGRWIWCEQPRIDQSEASPLARVARPDPVYGLFRKRIRVPYVVDSIPARLTADSRYVLWVNGVEVARGPVRGNGRKLRYDEIDLAPYLRSGDNVLAVAACYFGRANPWWAPVPAVMQLGAGAFLFESEIAGEAVVSDDSWRGIVAAGWTDGLSAGIGGMPPEVHDARVTPSGWREVDFDDSTWKPATLLFANSLGFSGSQFPPSHPYGPLLPRPIALLGCVPRAARLIRCGRLERGALIDHPVDQVLRDGAESQPLALPDGGGALALGVGAHVLTFDFDEVVSGTVVLSVDADAGTRIDLACTEFAAADGTVACDDERNGLRYIARGSEDQFESLRPFGCRYVGVSIRSESPVVVRDVSLRERLYPRPRFEEPDLAPSFECNDELLNRIWAVGRRSVDLNSSDAYTDCPTREQRAWTGDFVVHQMVDLTTHVDWRLARWQVELCASPRPDGMLPMAAGGDIESFDNAYIPDWALHWVHALFNLYRYTGQRDFVARMMPIAEGVLRWFVPFQERDGLLTDVPSWVIIDWSSVSVSGKSSVLNALWARALREFAEMGEWLGDGGRAAWARSLHNELASGFDAFWDGKRQLYIDHIDNGESRLAYSQHAQAAPLVAGLVPGDRVARILDVMLDSSRGVHATWSRASGDARHPAAGEHGVGGPYLIVGPPTPWWDVERQMVLAQPFFRYVVHDAVVAAGRGDLIPDLCRDWKALLERCPSSWSETWYGGTSSHGWGSTPTRDLMMYTLGVIPAAPGFGRARVTPRLGDLEWARGVVPTPYGPLRVELTRTSAEIDSPVPFTLEIGSRPPVEYGDGQHRVELS